MAKTKTEVVATNPAKWWIIILLLAIIAGAVCCFIFNRAGTYCKGPNTWPASLDSTDNFVVPSSPEEVTAAVAKLILLPEEKPRLAIIDEAAVELKTKEPFFKDALVDDRILLYSDRAIIYRPSQNIIINVGPISVIESNAASEGAWRLEVRNGSQTKGAATKLADSLKADKAYQIITTSNAANADYQGNQLVNLSGRDLTALAQKFNAKVVDKLPAGEASSSAEALLILGN